MQLRGARPNTCYGSSVEEGLYHSEIIVYWQVTKYLVVQKQHPLAAGNNLVKLCQILVIAVRYIIYMLGLEL